MLFAFVLFFACVWGQNWQPGDWGYDCDFYGKDLSNARVAGSECGGLCARTCSCTHFTWTDYNGGTCWMKYGTVSKADAIPKQGAVCGIVNSGGTTSCGTTTGSTTGGGNWKRATTTRYWDCSKPHCAWKNMYPNNSPNELPYRHDYAFKPCNGACAYGAKYFGTAAASTPIMGGNQAANACGKCYAMKKVGSATVPLVVQVNNLCPDYANPSHCYKDHFDIAVPGFDYTPSSASNTCKQSDPSIWFGSNGMESCATTPVTQCNCYSVSSDPVLVNGCKYFVELGWDNPEVEYIEVGCPTSLIHNAIEDPSATTTTTSEKPTELNSLSIGLRVAVVVLTLAIIVLALQLIKKKSERV